MELLSNIDRDSNVMAQKHLFEEVWQFTSLCVTICVVITNYIIKTKDGVVCLN